MWTDVGKEDTYDKIKEQWLKETKNGKVKTKYDDINYYDIFPANTVMFYSLEKELERIE